MAISRSKARELGLGACFTHVLDEERLSSFEETLASPFAEPEDREMAERTIAFQAHLRSTVAWYASRGITFIDWNTERESAIARYWDHLDRRRLAAIEYDERRRSLGDEEIIECAEEYAIEYVSRKAARMGRREPSGGGVSGGGDTEHAAATGGPTGLLITPERVRILRYILNCVHASARYWASRKTVALACSVGEATVQRFIRDLERAGVLVRIKTGGIREDGSRATNEYTLFHNRLRELLGVENKWKSKYDTDAASRIDKPLGSLGKPYNPYFNYSGFAHFSQSARQRRRLQRRWREGYAKLSADVWALTPAGHRDVENSRRRHVENLHQQPVSPVALNKTAGQVQVIQYPLSRSKKSLSLSEPRPVTPVENELLTLLSSAPKHIQQTLASAENLKPDLKLTILKAWLSSITASPDTSTSLVARKKPRNEKKACLSGRRVSREWR